MVLSSYEPHRLYHHHHTTPLTAFPNATSLVHHDRASVIDADTSPIGVVVAVEQQHDIVIIDLRIAEAVRAHVLNRHGERAGSGAQVCELECLRLSRRDGELE